jgi:PTH1 family peptidyl-tRNA hydrolase
LNFATIRVKAKGSSGSHNGLKSIIYHIQSDEFPRVKIGIGKKHENQDLADFVLSRFSKDEQIDMEAAYLSAAEAVETIIKEDINCMQ